MVDWIKWDFDTLAELAFMTVIYIVTVGLTLAFVGSVFLTIYFGIQGKDAVSTEWAIAAFFAGGFATISIIGAWVAAGLMLPPELCKRRT